MNKKLLFGALALAALTACTTDDFESQKVAEEVSPVQFEVINNDALTRASMDGNKIAWSAKDGDLFTLYHGGAGITNYENATYTAAAAEGKPAFLSTPSIIKAGTAIMVWPVDTAFRIRPADNLSIVIPADQKADIENFIPYVSDQITIGAYGAYNEDPAEGPVTAWNTEGKDRKYPVFMRPMASQLIVKADYAGTDAQIAELEAGEDGIEPIKVESIDLLTQAGGADEFTTDIDIKWTAPTAAILGASQWGSVAHNAWTMVTDFNLGAINDDTDKLTTVCLDGNNGCKFLLLPQNPIAGGVDDGAVVFNTIYGKVVVAAPGVFGSLYTAPEVADAWYRYISAASKTAGPGVGYDATETPAATAGSDGKFKTTSAPADGMMQTINGFSSYIATSGIVKGEPVGAAATRYVKVLLTKLDMSDLHIKTDKQLRDAARVWKKMGLTPVTVYLDGNDKKEFEISQKTIETINSINGAGLNFTVQPCQKAGEVCNTIVITGGGDVQNIAFIYDNAGFQADVAFNKGETWNWKGKVLVTDAGVDEIINRGTMVNAATATLQTFENGIGAPQNNIPFVNAEGAEWNITAGTLNVQFDVTNNGTVNIAKGAQYRQDGQTQNTVFTNEATAKPKRFGGNDAKIGKVINNGVFASVEKPGVYTAIINNYGLIEHADANAKTYVTNNQLGGVFATSFGAGNKMGRINLPWSNKDEDNVSISAALNQGFVSVTVDGEVTNGILNGTAVGSAVNYVIVKSGIDEIKALPSQIKYVEINEPGTEIAWTIAQSGYEGLMILSDVNIKRETKVAATVTYLNADMYVGGQFNNGISLTISGTPYAATNWNGYYGNTTGNVSSKYITY